VGLREIGNPTWFLGVKLLRYNEIVVKCGMWGYFFEFVSIKTFMYV